uniref:Uncharacterized protein n=1 Tax=Setaria digitata TaxID=48799 RepID=A0A915PSI4_9BILA
MERFCILIGFMVVLSMSRNYDQKYEKIIKFPHAITIKGVMNCGYRQIYAVLINAAEEVKYMKYGGMVTDLLRTSHYFLSERDGGFRIPATRYVISNNIYLNITHHCIPDDKRNPLKNCFMRARHKVVGDPEAVRFDIHPIHLEKADYQSDEVTCVDWPFQYPEFNETNNLLNYSLSINYS